MGFLGAHRKLLYAKVRAAEYFDEGYGADLRLNSGPQALEAWREVAASSTYQGKGPS
jgi:hypothetical protein